MLYSSTLHNPELQSIDSNSYAPFKLVDSTIINRISDELDAIDNSEEEGVLPVPFSHFTH